MIVLLLKFCYNYFCCCYFGPVGQRQGADMVEPYSVAC